MNFARIYMHIYTIKYIMKKHIFTFLALLLAAQMAMANVIVGQAAIPANYYNEVNAKSGADNILNVLHGIIDNHTVIPYGSLENYYEQTDFRGDTVWDMYSTCRFTMADANKSQSAVCDAWNKEHSIPQSWFNEASPMKSDLFHVYPTDARVNNFRSNYPYGEVAGGNGAGFSDNYQNHGLGKKGSNTFSGYTGTVFEPADEYKGDFARTYFYMVARYRDKALNASSGSVVFVASPTDLTAFAKNLFLKWHRQDPVSQKEIDRNQAVYGIQGNRNPFIDYPELAEYIWGNKIGQQIDLTTMTPTCEGGGYDPGSVVKYGVSWSVNGTIVSVDSIVAGLAITALPETPVSCSATSDLFVGWTTAPISRTQDEAPLLYKAVGEFPVVSADVTYYAVFAHAEQGAEITPAVYTYNAEPTDGWTNTASWTNSYWLLDAGKTLTSPEVELAGLSSITVNIRTYGGTAYNNLEVKANGQLITTIVATNGKTMTEYTWTNTQTLTGRAPLTFSTNYGSMQGIGFTSVTINATGANIAYSSYLTSCGGTSDVETLQREEGGRLVLVGGQIYILLGEEMYNSLGQKVK